VRGGILPPAFLFLALGLALGRTTRSTWAPSLIALLLSSATSSLLDVPRMWLEDVYLACWIVVIATAASVYFARSAGRNVVIAWSFITGLTASGVVAVSGSRLDLVRALPCVLVLIPTSWIVRRSVIPARVASSWLIAIAVMAAALQLLPVTPGYLPDHLE
jgi:hypothetical protein